VLILLRVSECCIILGSTRWHCATSRNVAGLIPDCGSTTERSTSNRNEPREYFLGCKGGRCVGLTNLPPSCADCFEIWETQTARTLKFCPRLYRGSYNIQLGAPRQTLTIIRVKKSLNKVATFTTSTILPNT